MEEPITIIGAGITGLAAAMLLCSNHKVTIVARDQPGDLGTAWASPWAGAVWHPQNEASKAEQVMQMASFQYYSTLASSVPSSKTGVQVLPMKEYFDDRTDDENIWYRDFMPDYRAIEKRDLPEGCTFGVTYSTLAMNPTILLPWLKTQLEGNGVIFIKKELKSVEEARASTGDTIVINASGIGAKELAGDASVRPIRGQTMFVRTSFNELVMKEGSEYTYIIPRAGSGGVILGGIKSDCLDTEVDVDMKVDILKRTSLITNGVLGDVDLETVTDIVAFRPGRNGGIRVEREGDVVHAYGVAGAGYIYSFGVAGKVKELVEEKSSKVRL